jgi:hypothetical protein
MTLPRPSLKYGPCKAKGESEMIRQMPTILSSIPVMDAALWAGRLLHGLATLSPPLACVMLWAQFYVSDGGLRDLVPPRQWLGLLFPGIH